MSGHNKWSKIKRSKGALDVKRGKLFSRLAKEISVASRMGGSDSSSNARLRTAVLAAHAQNMPNDNIDRAIKRGAGELGVANYEEIVYEGYAPGGIALIVETATDNKNRTAADLRLIFTKHEGNLASSGSVAYLFHRKGQISVPRDSIEEDRLLEAALEAGAEELTTEAASEESAGSYVVTTSPDQLYAVDEALRAAGVQTESQKLSYIPDTLNTITDEAVAAQVLRLCDALEENDDVQHVHANFDLSEEVLARLSA